MQFLSVSELNSQLKSVIKEHFCKVCVEGEICNLTKHQSGHCYFSLKDADSTIRCVLFKGTRAWLKIELENAQKVQITGEISLYEKRGEYQIICTNIAQCGADANALEKLKQKLKAEGLFEQKHKKPLPRFPHKIALITSKSGAALHDILFVANKRWNLIELSIFDTLVQGDEAKFQIAESIALADNGKFDIIVLARGGGSLEDLWAFNEEIVARAIFSAKTPIVSAIGHEVDFLLSDLVADIRAPTPSAAFEMILPDKTQWLLKLAELQNELDSAYLARITAFKNALEILRSKMLAFRFDYKKECANLADLRANLTKMAQNLLAQKCESANQKNALDSTYLRLLESQRTNLAQLRAILDSRNPKRLVEKGFVQITKDGAVANLNDLQKDDKITLSDGEISKNAVIGG
ncbi:exodeoxyribonuclease VII large subunit [Helicobacter sp. 23-1045]